MKRIPLILFPLILICIPLFSQIWNPNINENTYKNPIIFADYSDPDVVKVGSDFYITASSFNCFPALPVLHSKDLVNWELINHALKSWPDNYFDVPQHGNGVWAPSIRYHDGEFYIYWGDPDLGIFMVKTRDIREEWDPPILVKNAKGNIDPCPLWDDDGRVYLVHAFARSRAGINSVLHLNELSADGSNVIDGGTLIFDGHKNHPTLEGPKLYKRNGYYYIFAPAGGVAGGWQTVLRSKNVQGPYEDRTVLAQGATEINGPHQGGWIELENGENWFIHFQERQPYGRIVHLQPMVWKNDWPVMGHDPDGDGTGEPVLQHKKPDVGAIFPNQAPASTDEFVGPSLAMQWQWHALAKPEWSSLTARKGFLRLYPQPDPDNGLSLWAAPHLILQKLPAPAFTVTTKIKAEFAKGKAKAGLIVMGRDYAYLAVSQTDSGIKLSQVTCKNADRGAEEPTGNSTANVSGSDVFLQAVMKDGGECIFRYSTDGIKYTQLGLPFSAREGKWIGAKIGIFATKPDDGQEHGYVDFDYFRFE